VRDWRYGHLESRQFGKSASRTVTIMPTIRSGSGAPANGTVIPFFARAQNASIERAFLTRSLFVGTFLPIPSGDQPDIDLRGNAQVIVNGDSTPSITDGTDFGSAALGGSGVDRNFQIHNVGTAALQLTGNPRVTISGPGAVHFQVITQPANATVAAGANTTFTVRFAPTASGVRSALVSIANNDADENPSTFTIQGNGTGNLPDRILRNGFEPSL